MILLMKTLSAGSEGVFFTLLSREVCSFAQAGSFFAVKGIPFLGKAPRHFCRAESQNPGEGSKVKCLFAVKRKCFSVGNGLFFRFLPVSASKIYRISKRGNLPAADSLLRIAHYSSSCARNTITALPEIRISTGSLFCRPTSTAMIPARPIALPCKAEKRSRPSTGCRNP